MKDKKKVATSCWAISSLYYNLCQYDEALKYAQEALEISEEYKIGKWRESLTLAQPLNTEKDMVVCRGVRQFA